jgi:pimeloyl-ACP methyl ester carboxylesterase
MYPYILSAIVFIALLIIAGAFAKLEFQYPPNWRMIGFGFLILLGLGLYGIRVLNAPPTNGEITEEKREKPEVVAAATLKERLDQVLNADDYPNWSIASELAQCSSDAYLAPFDIESALKQRGYQDVTTLSFKSLAGYVAFLDDTAVVVFRGTIPSDFQNWMTNLDTRSEKSEHGNVHAGFWSAYGSMHEQLAKVLKAKKTKRIWITGHSLGGAMAAFCSYRLSTVENLEIAGLMTFGQPKVGSKSFCDHMESQLAGRVVYFVNETDGVTRIPPNFDQFGSLVWYTAGGIRRSKPREKPVQVRYGQAPGEVQELKDEDYFEIPAMSQEEFEQMKRDMMPQEVRYSPDGEPLMQGRLSLINDHNIDLYIERLK